jgi:hypothetical protein
MLFVTTVEAGEQNSQVNVLTIHIQKVNVCLDFCVTMWQELSLSQEKPLRRIKGSVSFNGLQLSAFRCFPTEQRTALLKA